MSRSHNPSISVEAFRAGGMPPRPDSPRIAANTAKVAARSNWHGKAVVVCLPKPPAACWPNARCHYYAVGRAKAKAKKMARWAAYQAMGDGSITPGWRKVTMLIEYFSTHHTAADSDNVVGACKAYRDGLVAAGVMANDDQVTLLPPQCSAKQPAHPTLGKAWVRITVRECP